MGLIQNIRTIFGRKQNNNNSIAILEQSNSMRTFFSHSIYNLPEIRTAINTIAEMISNVPIWRKRVNNKTGEVEYVEDEIHNLLNYSPNIIQNKSQFFSFIITKFLLNNAVAIEIVYDNGNISGLFPLPFYKMRNLPDINYLYFADDNTSKSYLRENIICLTRFSEIGRGTEGQATDLYEQIIQAIQQRAVENTQDGKKVVAAIKRQGTQLGTRAKEGDSIANVKAMEKQLQETTGSMSGYLYLDGATDIIPLNIPEVKIEKELLKTIVEAVYNYFGISENLVKGIANELEWQQCILKLPKFFCEQASQEFTRRLFSAREIGFGNRIEFDYLSLQLSTVDAKVTKITSGLLNGWLNQDESREDFGLPPLPSGLGKKYRGNLNSANLEVIDEYQLKKASGNGGFTQNEK